MWTPSTPAAAATSPPTGFRALGGARDLVTLFALVVLGVSGLLSALPPAQPEALPVVLVLALLGWWAYRVDRFAPAWPWVVLVAVPLAVPWTGAERSPLLPLLLCAGLTLGLVAPVRAMAAGAVLSLSLLAVGAFVINGAGDVMSQRDLAAAGGQWVALSVAVGTVAVWARRLVTTAPAPDPYAEVGQLLEQLRRTSQRLPSGLDAGAAATSLLERTAHAVPHDRSAVVVRPAGGSFVPLAVRGTARVPWRDSLDEPGPILDAWTTGLPVLDRRPPDREGRRHGNALLAVPLLAGAVPFGLLILDASPDGFAEDAAEVVGRIAAESTSQLEAALLFEEVRLATSTEERDRLAREMHDGIAQELAFLGYRLDDLRAQATPVDAAFGDAVGDLRRDLTSLMSDLRLSIASMRTSVRSDRGLGQVLGSYLQAVCTGKQVELTLTLRESAFRLPADQEVALLSAAQAFAQGVRRTPEVRELSVTLAVDPPSALLTMECDAGIGRVDLGQTRSVLEKVGGSVRITDESAARARLIVHLGGQAE